MRASLWAGFAELLGQHRTIPALRLKRRSGSCGTASALPKCSIMSGCGTRIVLQGQKPLALCDRRPCFGSLFPPLAALTFAASSIICAFGLASAAPRSPYRHLELCGIALLFCWLEFEIQVPRDDAKHRPLQIICNVHCNQQSFSTAGSGDPALPLFCSCEHVAKRSAGNGQDRSGTVLYIPSWDLAQGSSTGHRPLQIVCMYPADRLCFSTAG